MLGVVALFVGEFASVFATERLGLPVHWATVILIAICGTSMVLMPLLVAGAERWLNGARRREDLEGRANAFAESLHERWCPRVAVWSSPETGYEGSYHVWVGNEVHVFLRSDVDSMPESARDFALARTVDSAISSRRRGLRLIVPDWHLLVGLAAVLLSAALGEWVILGSCLAILVPMFCYMLVTFWASKRSSAWWPDKRQLAVDRRAVWATGGMAGARAWYTERVGKTEGHAREMYLAMLTELEHSER